jgi:magnesium-transporting ATPase (P-type)
MGSTGLTLAEARARLTRDGPNEVPAPKLRSPAGLFADRLFHLFAAMLWVASVLARLRFALAVLCIEPIARQMKQAVPPLAGWLVALASPIVLPAVDTGDNWWHWRASRH